MAYPDVDKEWRRFIGAVKIVATVAVLGGTLMLWGCPQYGVYTNRLGGQATFERAEQDRRVKIEEAKAAFESAKLHASAEVERARGTAEANKILQENLGGPENYLRWRTIQMLEETGRGAGRETVYIPTEAMMPITEAGKTRR
jgi:hypothetical protein